MKSCVKRYRFSFSVLLLCGLLLFFPITAFAWTTTSTGARVAVFGNFQESVDSSVAVDSLGNAYTAGIFGGTIDVDPGPGIVAVTSTGSSNMIVVKTNYSGELDWARSFGNSNSSFYVGPIVVDGEGNSYLTGHASGISDFDPGSGVATLPSGGFVLKLDKFGDLVWAKSIGGVGRNAALNSTGGVYVSGEFTGSKDFNPGAGVFNLTSGGQLDIFILSLNADGEFVRAIRLGNSWDNFAPSLHCDGAGNLLISGSFNSTIDFDPGIGDSSLTSAGDEDFFVLKLSSVGDFLWVKGFGSLGLDMSQQIVADSIGNMFVGGFFTGTVDFDPGPSSFPLSAAGSNLVVDAFVLKIAASGEFVWAQRFGAGGNDYGRSIAVDTNGAVYLAGDVSGATDFDSSEAVTRLVPRGGRDAFVVKIDSLGGFAWARLVGGSGDEYGTSVSVDSNRRLNLAGRFVGDVDFDVSEGVSTISSKNGFSETFLLVFDQLGMTSPTTSTTTSTTIEVLVPNITTVPSNPEVVQTTPQPFSTNPEVPRVSSLPAPKVTLAGGVSYRSIAAFAKLNVSATSKVSLKVISSSAKYCRATGTSLKGLKVGSCKVTVTVTPKKGRAASKTVTLKVTK
jgi:hypothetical protein